MTSLIFYINVYNFENNFSITGLSNKLLCWRAYL